MIEIGAYADTPAMEVFRNLDPSDWAEAQLVRGVTTDHLTLWCDWRAAQAGAVLSMLMRSTRLGGRPFAVMALAHTGVAGVAQAAMLARSHARYAPELAAVARRVRRKMPGFCRDAGINRVEARCWADHPSAAQFLRICGFSLEATLAGFGGASPVHFHQFAWTQERTPHVPSENP